MKCETVMILWHNKDPIYSTDFDPTSNKFCTTGFDNEIKIWGYTKNKEGHLSVEFLSSLVKHVKPVNVARFSPGGNLLASGSDDGSIVIWRLNQNAIPPSDSSMKEIWSIVTVLRVTTDVYDLSWSCDGQYLSTVSTDNSVSIWSPLSKTHHQLITEHSHYVQGVSWDPLNDFMITQSSDGTCRIYRNEKKKKKNITQSSSSAPISEKDKDSEDTNDDDNNNNNNDSNTTNNTGNNNNSNNNNSNNSTTIEDINTNSRRKLNLLISNVLSRRSYNNTSIPNDNIIEIEQQQDDATKTKEESLVSHRMFYDERASTFFRRPSWSPDGSIFITPTGKFKDTPTSKYQSTSYIFSRHIRDRPLVHLPSNNPTVVVKFNPIIFKLRSNTNNNNTNNNDIDNNNNNNNLLNINYRMIFAISSQDTVAIYDTQKTDKPISIVSNLHYSSITDVSWSSDGSILLIASSDGFCSYVSFAPNELGEALPESEYPESLKQCILYKQRAIVNTTINEQLQQQFNNSNENKNNLKRKNDSNNNVGESNDNSTSNGKIRNDSIVDENEQTKKQKTDEEIPTTLPTIIPTTLSTTNDNNNTTVTTTTTTDAKPKRRIQPNLIKK
ncbi:hypothetical protein ACTFIV_000452 [Dictyostelium citrinum]